MSFAEQVVPSRSMNVAPFARAPSLLRVVAAAIGRVRTKMELSGLGGGRSTACVDFFSLEGGWRARIPASIRSIHSVLSMSLLFSFPLHLFVTIPPTRSQKTGPARIFHSNL